jgi:VWFA-related protein
MTRQLVSGAAMVVGSSLIVLAQASDARPQFRTGIDVIRLDISVLDRSGAPVHGLKASDFTVLENGRPQQLIAVSEIDDEVLNPTPSAQMRYARRDVSANDLSELATTGRLVAIVIDDRLLPFDDVDIAMSARAAARRIVDDLGPADMGTVVYVEDPGNGADFTADHDQLLTAIDEYQPHEVPFIERDPIGLAGPTSGDERTLAPAYAGSECLRTQPTVPRLETVVARLARVPQQRRKTVFYVGPGVGMQFDVRGKCDSQLYTIMRDMFRQAQMANVNIHTVDPLGPGGFAEYARNRRETGRESPWLRLPPPNLMRDWLEITAENTGGVAIVATDKIEDRIDDVFRQDTTYYLVGYQTSNGNPDGSFRTIKVRVNRPGVTVRTRTGYWAPDAKGHVNADGNREATAMELNGSGLMHPDALPLRVFAAPVGLAPPAGGSPQAVVAVVLTPRVPALGAPGAETLAVSRTVYGRDGETGTPYLETARLSLPASVEAGPYDVLARVVVPAGRHDIRFSAHSTIADATGGVDVAVDVPDFAHAPLSTTPIVLSHTAAGVDRPVSGSLADVLPIVPTTDREFSPSDQATAFLRVFEGGTTRQAVTMTTRLTDATDTVHLDRTETLPADAFGAERPVDVQVPLPLDRLAAGPYVLSMEAKLPGGRSSRQDLVFRVN